MPSTYETIGLIAFASRVPAIFVRKKMKKHLLGTLDPDGRLREEEDDLIDSIAALRRKPDAVAILDEAQSRAAGLPHSVALAIVDKYGSVTFPDLGGIYVAMLFLSNKGISNAEAIDAHAVRNIADV